MTLRFAANLSLLFAELPLIERFRAAKAAGFEAVEMQFPYELPAETIAAELANAAVPMVLFNTPPGDFAAGDRGFAAVPGREADFEAAFARTLDYAKALHTKLIHVMAGVPPAGTDPAEADRTFVRNLRAALAESADMAENAGMDLTLLIEPLNQHDMPGYHLSKFAHARRLIEAVGDARLGLQLDLYHRQVSEGDLERALRDYIDIARHIQIAGAPSRNEPDIGEINYRYLFGVIEELGYTGRIGAEYRPRGDTVAGLGWRERLAGAAPG